MQRVRYFRSVLVLIVCWGLALPSLQQAEAQPADTLIDNSSGGVTWRVRYSDSLSSAPINSSYPVDSVSVAAHQVVQNLQRRGYYHAAITGVDTAVTNRGRTVTFSVEEGQQAVIEQVRVSGIAAGDSLEVARLLGAAEGKAADQRHLQASIDQLLNYYANLGHPLAEVRMKQVDLHGSPPQMKVNLQVEEGPAVVLADVKLPGSKRVDVDFAVRLLELSLEERLVGYNPKELRRRLLETQLFASVGKPVLELQEKNRAVLKVPVEEAPPGRFNFALGYDPGGGNQTGQIVGNGFIHLQNLFGTGRQFHFEMDRLSGQVSQVVAGVDLPFTAGLPLRTHLQFEGYQQDSTYGTQEFEGELGYKVASGLELAVFAQRKLVSPGGLNRTGALARSHAWYGGLTVTYRQLDHRYNPRQGVLLTTSLQQGRKQRQDTSAILYQQRLQGSGRFFVPTFERQVLVAGYDGWFINSPKYDEADLFKVGGARTLRGYAENRFHVSTALRGLLEYRLQIDPRSYAFVFTDLGYLYRPAYRAKKASRMVRSGYGVGLQLQTGVGLMKISYALNPTDGPAGGKVHVGLSLGL